MKKLICIILSLICVFSAVAVVGCTPTSNVNNPGKEYNIIFTLATIPPVLAALDCISNGNETYAFIERGKTYNGIDNVTGFSNIGFIKDNNTGKGFTNANFDDVVEKIKELNVNGNEKFNLYVCDYTVLMGFGLAACAELKDNQYQIVLCENGGGTYEGLDSDYLTGRTVNSSTDEPYEKFIKDVASVKSKIDAVLAKNRHKVNFEIGYDLAYPAATLSNVRYLVQDKVSIKNHLEKVGSDNCKTKLLPVFGFEEDSDLKINFDFGSISERVDKLQPAQKENYLKLMYGEYFEDTHSTLTRTTLSDNVTKVPSQKLVFIGSRANDYPPIAQYFGYEKVKDASQVPDTYDKLDSMYKTEFLFGKEDDYLLFINTLKDATNYENNALPEKKFLDAIKVDCFNYYIEYLVALKFTYLKYGKDYDIVLKGHPGEVLGEHETWSKHYDVIVNGDDYRFDKLYDNLLLAFHEQDSIGKYIGLIPFGTAAENLAYLGVDISLCGLSSGTYTGYEQSVDIKFVMATKDTANAAIDSDTNISGRYANGTLLDHDEDGNETITTFFNVGNLYKHLIEYYSSKENGNNEYKAYYEQKFASWLRAVNGLPEGADTNGYDVDNQGFLITPDK